MKHIMQLLLLSIVYFVSVHGEENPSLVNPDHGNFKRWSCCRGATGPTGPTGPLAPQSWVQLYDRNYTNELTANGQFLNLSNEGINSNFTTGGYTLFSTTTTNSIMEFPSPGHYLVQINMKTSFLNSEVAPYGTPYQIIFNIFDYASNVGSMALSGVIASDPNAIMQDTFTSSLIVYNPTDAPRLRINLSNFNSFSYAYEGILSVYDIAIQVQKLEL